jgi:hypothetical protein
LATVILLVPWAAKPSKVGLVFGVPGGVVGIGDLRGGAGGACAALNSDGVGWRGFATIVDAQELVGVKIGENDLPHVFLCMRCMVITYEIGGISPRIEEEEELTSRENAIAGAPKRATADAFWCAGDPHVGGNVLSLTHCSIRLR